MKNFECSAQWVYGSGSCRCVNQRADVTVDKSHFKQERQLHCWLCHTMKFSILEWPISESYQKQMTQEYRLVENNAFRLTQNDVTCWTCHAPFRLSIAFSLSVSIWAYVLQFMSRSFQTPSSFMARRQTICRSILCTQLQASQQVVPINKTRDGTSTNAIKCPLVIVEMQVTHGDIKFAYYAIHNVMGMHKMHVLIDYC